MESEMHTFVKIVKLKTSLLVIFLLITILSFGQGNKLTLTGTIRVATGEVFPYKLVFTEVNGIVKGHSFTYSVPDETKATITGILDKRERILNFKETEILYSHEVHTKAFMCLIDAHTEYLQGARDRILRGPISSAEADKTTCTPGILTFDNQEELKNLFESHEKFDTVITLGKKPKQAPVVAEPTKKPFVEEPLVTDKITRGVEKTYEWHTDTVVIDIWDGGKTDGDQVTLEYNGKQYLSKYSLVKQHKQLRIPIAGKGVGVITILADNEGWDPPNTASLLLTDGTVQHSVLSYNNKGQVSVIKIKRVY